MEFTSDRIRLKRSAHQKLSTVKPGIIKEAIITKKAFMTNKNNPSVINVIGIVKKIKTGLMVKFNKANKAAMIIPVRKSSTEIPGSR